MYIDDYGTRGLIGPEYEKDKHRFSSGLPHCFLGLCRNIGDSQKGEQTLGGTHGLGKTVLWKNSRLKLVVFYSRMQIPYKKEGESTELQNRFFGQVRLTGHEIEEQSFKGEGYFGDRQASLTWSLFDSIADGYAEKLNIPIRKNNNYGTSILIVDFDDPDIEDEKESMENTARSIKEATEKYFWPAMIENKLSVRSGVESEGKLKWSQADVISSSYLPPYIEAYEYATGKKNINDQSNDSIVIKNFDITVPKGPGNEDKKADTSLRVATKLIQSDAEHGDETMINRAALIRGSGMVIGYVPIPRRGLAARDYHTVVLGGRAYPENSISRESQERLEMLLAWAEPVTHDMWTDNTDALKQWYGARPRIRQIMADIKRAVSEVTVDQTPPEGKAAHLLASMFPIDTGPRPPPTSRDIHIEVTRPPYRIDTNNGDEIRYGFEIRVRVPARGSFTRRQKPDRWKVECKYGFYGEGRTRRIIAYAPISFTGVKKNEDAWEEIKRKYMDMVCYEDSVKDQENSYSLTGETDILDTFLALSTKHELEVRIERGFLEEMIE